MSLLRKLKDVPKRVSLKERREQDKRGLDKLIDSSPQKAEETAEKLRKATYYIRPEQDITLETIQLSEHQKSGKRKDKSELVREAIDLLASKYGVKPYQ